MAVPGGRAPRAPLGHDISPRSQAIREGEGRALLTVPYPGGR